jgi:hypothetical protein
LSGEVLAKKAYEAYGEYLHWEGLMLRWDQLPVKVQGAFTAYAREVIAQVQQA